MKMLFAVCAGLSTFISIAAASDCDNHPYTLYRSSVAISEARIHVATFDADDGIATPSYNSENCQIAAELFQGQRGVRVRYWCEPGRYRRE
jgi:hypothetical protein